MIQKDEPHDKFHLKLAAPGKFPFPEASFSGQFQFYFRSVSLSAFLAYIIKKKKNPHKYTEIFIVIFSPVDEVFFLSLQHPKCL